MKLVIKNSSLKFEESNITPVHEVFGNDVAGMTSNAYIKANGGTQSVGTPQNYGITPFIDIDGVVSAIDITYLFSGYDSKVFVAFYSDATESSFISAILRQDGGNQSSASLQVALADIPAGAKYLRFNPQFGTSQDSSYSKASEISFNKSL